MRTLRDVEAYLGGTEPAVRSRGGAGGDVSHPFLGPDATDRAPRGPSAGGLPRPHRGRTEGDHHPLPFYRKLLELNAQALVHSSYGLDGQQIVLCSALELENLDFNELEATLDELDMTLVQQVPVLSELSKRSP